MLLLRRGRRTKGRLFINLRTLLYFGWAISTLTLLAILISAINPQPFHWGDTADGNALFQTDRKVPADDTERRPVSVDFKLAERQRDRRIGQRHHVSGKDRHRIPPDRSGFGIHSSNGSRVSQLLNKEVYPVTELAPDVRTRNRIKSNSIRRSLGNSGSELDESEALELNSFYRETQLASVKVIDRSSDPLDQAPQTMDGNDHPATQLRIPDWAGRKEREISAWNENGTPLVEDGIYWSEEVEQMMPTGLVERHLCQFKDVLSRMSVRSMELAQWNRCGRPKNQYVTLEDGTPLCARYRHPQDSLIRGEVLSFYLSKLLDLDFLPPVVLSYLNASDPLWRTQNFTATADWNSGTFVSLIQWMDDLNYERSRVHMPGVLLSSYESGLTLMARSLDRGQWKADQLTSFIQWTDLIVFDYITGHYDRVASMQDGAEREGKPSILAESIRNLRQISGNGKLILIDNESGLFDGYELMYRGASAGSQFIGFHRRLLQTICVFRRLTVARLRWLAGRSHPDRTLEEYASLWEPLYRKLKPTPEVDLFRTYFKVRLKEVLDWIDHCNAIR